MKIMSIYDGVEIKYYDVTEAEQKAIEKFLALDSFYIDDMLEGICGVEINFMDEIEVKKF